jgi:two-component system, chemotaxis family, CheB/CheR fusion protein
MIVIDMKTVMITNIIVDIICLIEMLRLWQLNRNKYRGLNYWVADFAMQAGGALLISLRGIIPNWASMVLSNALIVGGTLVLFYGLSRFGGKKIFGLLNFIIPVIFVVFILVQFYYSCVNDNLTGRNYNISISLGFTWLLCLWLLIRGVSQEIRLIAVGPGIVFVMFITITLARIAGFAVLPQTSNDFFKSGLFDTYIVLLYVGMIIFLTISLGLMVNSRLYDEIKQAKRSLQESEEKYRFLFANMVNGFAYCRMFFDPNMQPLDFVFLEINGAFEKITGLKNEQVSGKKITEAIPEIRASNPELFDIYGKVALDGQPASFEVYIKPLNRWLATSAFSPQKEYFVAVFDNITERKRTADAISEQRSQLLSIINSPKDILIFSLDSNYCYTAFNENHQKMMKNVWHVDIKLGMNLLDYMTIPELKEVAKKSIDRTLAGESFSEVQLQNNLDIWFEFNWNPIRNQHGSIIGVTSFVSDFTNRKQAEARLIEIEALKKISQAKSELLANVSHELRTPLTSIKGFIETLIETDVKWRKKKQLEFLKSANAQADRLTLLIKDLLDMSRIDSGKLSLDQRSYPVGEILDSVSGVLSVITEKHKLKIVQTPDLPPVQADKVRISQVIIDLVENATKFSAEGSEIVIEVKLDVGNVIISVQDNGIGMAPEVVAKLFDRFYQAQSVVEGKTQGTGLGLAICKGIMEAHGGKIWVESQQGRGSKFSFNIPVNPRT